MKRELEMKESQLLEASQRSLFKQQQDQRASKIQEMSRKVDPTQAHRLKRLCPGEPPPPPGQSVCLRGSCCAAGGSQRA